jgi:hypothetical protein
MKEKPTQAKLKEGSLLLYFGTNYQLELCQEWGKLIPLPFLLSTPGTNTIVQYRYIFTLPVQQQLQNSHIKDPAYHLDTLEPGNMEEIS